MSMLAKCQAFRVALDARSIKHAGIPQRSAQQAAVTRHAAPEAGVPRRLKQETSPHVPRSPGCNRPTKETSMGSDKADNERRASEAANNEKAERRNARP